MNPWWLVATSIFDAFQKNSAEKKRRKRELEQIAIEDKKDEIFVNDKRRWMGNVNKKDWVMKGETDPALWSTIAQYVNPIDHEAQGQINADLYDTTTDVADIEAVPTGFVAEGYAPAAAAAATRVSAMKVDLATLRVFLDNQYNSCAIARPVFESSLRPRKMARPPWAVSGVRLPKEESPKTYMHMSLSFAPRK